MVNKEETKNCTEKTKTEFKNKGGGYKEQKDPLTNKGKRHSAAALKNRFEKEQISEVAITPEDKEQETKTLTLRFKDSNKFLDAVYEFEELKNITIPLDFEEGEDGAEGSFLVGVSKELGIEFEKFMTEKGFERADDKIDAKMAREIEAKIAEVQNARSKSALNKDNSITAQTVGDKFNSKNLNFWLTHPNLSDLENIDTATENKTIS